MKYFLVKVYDDKQHLVCYDTFDSLDMAKTFAKHMKDGALLKGVYWSTDINETKTLRKTI